MKIIQIGEFPVYQDYIKGGVESSVFGLSREYTNKGNEVIVFDTPRASIKKDFRETIHRKDRKDFDVYRFAAQSKRDRDVIARIPSMLKLILAEKPDVCHLHTTGYYSLRFYNVLRSNKIPVVVSAHGLIHESLRKGIRRNILFSSIVNYFLRSLAEYIFISKLRYLIVDTNYVKNTIRKYARQLKIWHQPECIVIPQGVARPFFEQTAHPEPYTMLSVGAIIKRKGYLQLVDVMYLLKKMFPEIRLVIVGALADISYFEDLKEKIHAQKLDKNIVIEVDIPFEKLMEYYCSSQLFVLQSQEESQGIVLCEAMAIGMPIVATDVGGIRSVVTDGVNGYLSAPGDIHSMVNHILSLLQLEDVRQAMSHKNREDAEQYRWKTIAAKVMEEYQAQIDRQNRKRRK